jgi:hypothetical protein
MTSKKRKGFTSFRRKPTGRQAFGQPELYPQTYPVFDLLKYNSVTILDDSER